MSFTDCRLCGEPHSLLQHAVEAVTGKRSFVPVERRQRRGGRSKPPSWKTALTLSDQLLLAKREIELAEKLGPPKRIRRGRVAKPKRKSPEEIMLDTLDLRR